jgi:hypothetical protein
MRTWIVTAASLLMMTVAMALLPAPLAAGIYRCAAANEPPRYSQFPCGTDAEVVLQTLQIVELPPISAQEQAMLEHLDRERTDQRAARERAQRKAARDADHERAARTARCRSARSALEALAHQRRKGYSIRQARELDRQEADLETAARDNC